MASASEHNRTVVEQHNLQAEGYARLTGSLGQETDRAAQMRERLGASEDDVVLDVACGPGRLTLELAPHVRHVTGLDLTPGMLEQAQTALAQSGCANVAFVQGDAAAMPFDDATFSVVMCSAAFHHFETPAKVLAEMARVCRPGGRVAVSDVTPAANKAAGYDRMERMRDPSHGHAHSADELIAMGRELGLSDPRHYPSVAGPMPFSAVLATSFPETHSRDELLALMREDAVSGVDAFGFSAQVRDGEVLVTYPMSLLVWTRP